MTKFLTFLLSATLLLSLTSFAGTKKKKKYKKTKGQQSSRVTNKKDQSKPKMAKKKSPKLNEYDLEEID